MNGNIIYVLKLTFAFNMKLYYKHTIVSRLRTRLDESEQNF